MFPNIFIIKITFILLESKSFEIFKISIKAKASLYYHFEFCLNHAPTHNKQLSSMCFITILINQKRSHSRLQAVFFHERIFEQRSPENEVEAFVDDNLN